MLRSNSAQFLTQRHFLTYCLSFSDEVSKLYPMTLTRKQREIAQRHALFLEIALDTVASEGVHNLAMDVIAEKAEYSKGTVYQHFTCKEEILIQLCISALDQLHNLFEKAAGYEGTPRDRVIAIFYAHHLWSSMEPTCIELQKHMTMHGLRDKVTDQSRQQHDELEQRVVSLVAGIVLDAVSNGDLELPKDLTAVELVFTMWSLTHGGQLLQASDLPLEDFGIRNPNKALIKSLTLMLDGLKWKPLHNDEQFAVLLSEFQHNLFKEEHSQFDLKLNFL